MMLGLFHMFSNKATRICNLRDVMSWTPTFTMEADIWRLDRFLTAQIRQFQTKVQLK